MTHADWVAIAEYVRGVARQAYLRGYGTGLTNAKGHYAQDLREMEADVYVASGFDVETVKKQHPAGGWRRITHTLTSDQST